MSFLMLLLKKNILKRLYFSQQSVHKHRIVFV